MVQKSGSTSLLGQDAQPSVVKNDVRALIDHNALAYFRVNNLPKYIGELMELNVFSHPDWQYAVELITDNEFGSLLPETPDRFAEVRKQLSALEVNEIDFVLTSVKSSEWLLVLTTKENVAVQRLNKLMDMLLGHVANRVQHPDEDAIPSGERSPIVSELSAQAGDVSYWTAKSFGLNWFCFGNRIVFSNSLAGARKFADRLSGRDLPRFPLAESRKFKTLKANLNRDENAGIWIEFDPRLVFQLGLIDSNWYKALALDEMLAVGISIETRAGGNSGSQRRLVADAFVLVSQPRQGLANPIVATPITRFPAYPDSSYFVMAFGYDANRLWTELGKAMSDSENPETDDGKFFKNDELATILGKEYVETTMKIRKSAGPFRGYVHYLQSIDGRKKVGSITIRQTEDPTIDRELFREALAQMERISPINVTDVDFNGDHALMMATDKTSPASNGTLWFDGWRIQGNRWWLEQIAEKTRSSGSQLNKELQSRIATMKKDFGHRRDPCAFVETSPEYFQAYVGTAFLQLYAEQERRDLSPTQLIELMKNPKKMKADMSLRELKPSSVSESRQIAALAMSNAFIDTFGNTLTIASDQETGFKISSIVVDGKPDKELSK